MIEKRQTDLKDDSETDVCMNFSCSPRPVCSILFPRPLLFWLLCHRSSLSADRPFLPECLLPLSACLEETCWWSSEPPSGLSESHPAGHSHSLKSVSSQRQSKDSWTSVSSEHLCWPAGLSGVTRLCFSLRLRFFIPDWSQIKPGSVGKKQLKIRIWSNKTPSLNSTQINKSNNIITFMVSHSKHYGANCTNAPDTVQHIVAGWKMHAGRVYWESAAR